MSQEAEARNVAQANAADVRREFASALLTHVREFAAQRSKRLSAAAKKFALAKRVEADLPPPPGMMDTWSCGPAKADMVLVSDQPGRPAKSPKIFASRLFSWRLFGGKESADSAPAEGPEYRLSKLLESAIPGFGDLFKNRTLCTCTLEGGLVGGRSCIHARHMALCHRSEH